MNASKTSKRLLLGCFLFATSVASAMITNVQISPAEPTDQDTIIFSLEGWFNDGCWNVGEMSFAQISEHDFSAGVLGIDVWQPGFYCIMIMVGYLDSATIGPLDIGTYSIHVVEDHQSLRDPFPEYGLLTFEVTQMTAIRELVAFPDGDDIALQWPAVGGALSYQIYRAPSAEFEHAQYYLIDSTAVPEYRDAGALLRSEQRSFYYVTFTR